MPISDDDAAELVTRLSRDVAQTVGARYAILPQEHVESIRGWDEDDVYGTVDTFTQKVVDDVQQELMDRFVDTSWPTCPRHASHPLWFHDGAWYCDRDGEALAPLGGLSNIFPSPAPESPRVPGAFVRRPRKV